MWKYCGIYNVLCIIITIVYGHDFRSFDDTVLFKINWPGKSGSDLLVSINEIKLILKNINIKKCKLILNYYIYIYYYIFLIGI